MRHLTTRFPGEGGEDPALAGQNSATSASAGVAEPGFCVLEPGAVSHRCKQPLPCLDELTPFPVARSEVLETAQPRASVPSPSSSQPK